MGVAPTSVSVIIPTYDRAPLVPRAVASALACLRPGDEVIVVDDGSSDATEAALAPFGDHVRYLRLAHGGAGWARNRGVQEAHGALVAFLDSDDQWAPDKIELQRALMERRPDVLFCSTDFAVHHDGSDDEHHYLARWHGDGRRWDAILGPGHRYSSIAPLPAGRADFDVHIGDLYPEVLHGHFVATFTLMVRRAGAGDALWFAEDVPTYEDLECHARLARTGLEAHLDCETAVQWGHAGVRLTDADAYECASARLTVIERVYGHDRDFLTHHGGRYAGELRRQHLIRARWLLARGRAPEARRELRAAGGGPLAYRLAALAPGWLLSLLRRGVRAGQAGRRAVARARHRDG